MTNQNYTSINYLLKDKQKTETVSKPKEAEPIKTPAEALTIKEAKEHIKLDQEVKPYIQVRKETIKLPPDLKKIGVKATQTTHFPTYENVKSPLTDDKIITGLHAPITSSLRWLATFAIYLLKRAHLTLKVVHGKVIRVVKR